jgi:hypothetical protein
LVGWVDVLAEAYRVNIRVWAACGEDDNVAIRQEIRMDHKSIRI